MQIQRHNNQGTHRRFVRAVQLSVTLPYRRRCNINKISDAVRNSVFDIFDVSEVFPAARVFRTIGQVLRIRDLLAFRSIEKIRVFIFSFFFKQFKISITSGVQ